jgi:hypothetical protein
MKRIPWALLLGLLLVLPGGTGAAGKDEDKGKEKDKGNQKDKGPAGNYKLFLLLPDNESFFFLLKMDVKDSKWGVTALASNDERFEVTGVTGAGRSGNRLRFTLKVQAGRQQMMAWSFEGTAPKEKGKPILGSISLGPRQGMFPARLEPTSLTKLDRFALDKETLAKHGNSYKACLAVMNLLRQLKGNKVEPEEVKGWADKAFKIAGRYGPRFQHHFVQQVVDALDKEDVAPAVLLEYAQKLIDLGDPSEGTAKQMRDLERVIALLKKAKKPDEAKKYEARIGTLEEKAYQDYLKRVLVFKPDPYKGRKAKGTRVVLVELFTGAHSADCVAADLACDALGKAFKTSEVVVLEYHLHMPNPDPLTGPASWARRKYYVDDLEEVPSAFFNGKLAAPGGGGDPADAEDKYRQYREVIEPLLEKPTKVKLTAAATRKGDKLSVTAEVSGVEKPGLKVRLRLALVEDVVKYAGRNGLQYHHHVVRAMPGGPDGLALTRSTGKQSATVDLKKLRAELNTYLDNYAKRRPFVNQQRPLDLVNLRVVAYVQNDETREVLQAVEVKVGKKGTEVGKKGKKEDKEK